MAARTLSLLAASALLATGCAAPPAATVAELDPDSRDLLYAALAEEDSRPPAADAVALRAALTADQPLVRRLAARGLGRLEDPGATETLAAALDDPDPSVRRAAAGAIAQSVFGADPGDAADLLRGRLAGEPDAATRGALAQALGRVRPASADDLNATIEIIAAVATPGSGTDVLIPALRGIEASVRGNRGDAALSDAVRARLVVLTRFGRRGAEGFVEPADGEMPDPDAAAAAARIRWLALATLDAAGAADADTVETALFDPDAEVRRLAAAASGRIGDAQREELLLQMGLADDRGPVRFEALRGYARRLRVTQGCGPIVAAIEDPDPDVSLQAIDLLATGCRGVDAADPDDPPVAELLRSLAVALPGLPSEEEVRGTDFDGINPPIGAGTEAPPVAWHRAAHALVSLSRLDPDAAVRLLAAYAWHPTWQVRMYAARAAAAIGAVDVLEQLSEDPAPNVVDAALRGLDTHWGDGVDGAAVESLQSGDYQHLMTAAGMLEGTTNDAALDALLAALDRVTAEQRETSRDARRALLERVGELGDADASERVLPYLRDFDPAIAEQAAEILLAWTGSAVSPAPVRLPLTPYPEMAELVELDGARATIEMAGGGSFVVELHAFEAPTNVARFARQARSGYFEGLTFHRVVPNFVIQGGSPGANEYVGDGPFSRDELGDRSHTRGTVGISTRGRDTGDSQIFVNLIDNVRLDHNYTIIGTVVSGLDVVDAVLEGATIERVTIEPRDDPE